jgi:hypothetical protein
VEVAIGGRAVSAGRDRAYDGHGREDDGVMESMARRTGVLF